MLRFIALLFLLIRLGSSLNTKPLHSSLQSYNEVELQAKTLRKMEWKPEGYSSWKWKGNSINYVEYGDRKKPPLLLIHGFGASVFHWRYNIPALSEKYNVFAFDMLGFGLSDKPIMTYSSELWRDQALDFIESVVYEVNKQPCVIAGNSLGGFTALYAAASDSKKLIRACILLNAAGQFRGNDEQPKKEQQEWVTKLQASFQRFVIGLSFYYTKQPLRIEQVLRQVYPADDTNVDAGNELGVDSMQQIKYQLIFFLFWIR